jgi:hypothetical protein
LLDLAQFGPTVIRDTVNYQPQEAMPMLDQLTDITDAVQRNCDIADAHHAQDYTLCIYLLKMREYFRWEMNIPLRNNPEQETLSRWITAREAHWDEIMEDSLTPLPLANRSFDPFASEAINQQLAPFGVIYSGGYSALLKPSFFLADLLREEQHGDFHVYYTGRERARDLIAPPGMLQGTNIFVRQDAVRRFVNERWEEWQWHKRDDALGKAFKSYQFDTDPSGLDRMTDIESRTVALHELGEARAGITLDDGWNEMLVELGRSRAELVARAARDHLADCLSTLPALIATNNTASLAFYFSNLSGIRREIFPQLNDAFKFWLAEGKLAPLSYITKAGRKHWQRITERMLDRYRTAPETCREFISEFIEEELIIQ